MGQAYIRASDESDTFGPLNDVLITETKALWASEPFYTFLPVMSGKDIPEGGDPDDWPCNRGPENVSNVGTVNIFDVFALGLVPPFHVE